VYDEDGKLEEIPLAFANDSSQVQKITIHDLPTRFEGTDVLIHPIGYIDNLKNKAKFRSKYGSGSQTDFGISNSYKDRIDGIITNVIFEDVKTGARKELTERKLQISRIQFAKELFEVNEAQYLIYTVTDSDTNQDQRLNGLDIQSLYISQIDGSDFQKLNKDLSQVIAWEILPKLGRLYFRTVEDSNRNGLFDIEDDFTNFFCELRNTEKGLFKVHSYKFVQN